MLLNIASFLNKAMAEYITKYPKTISFLDVVCGSLKGIVNIDNRSNVEQLHVVVKKMQMNYLRYSYMKVLQRSNLNTNNLFKLVMVFL